MTNETSAGQRLKAWREKQRLTYEAAGKRLGCSHAHVRRLERDEVEPGVDQAARIESATRIPMRAWVKESP